MLETLNANLSFTNGDFRYKCNLISSNAVHYKIYYKVVFLGILPENPSTGGDSSMTLSNRYDLLSNQGVLYGRISRQCKNIEDAPESISTLAAIGNAAKNAISGFLKAIAVIVVVAVAAVAVTALIVGTGGMAFPFIVAGIIGVSGAAAFGAADNSINQFKDDVIDGETASSHRYFQTTLEGAVTDGTEFGLSYFSKNTLPPAVTAAGGAATGTAVEDAFEFFMPEDVYGTEDINGLDYVFNIGTSAFFAHKDKKDEWDQQQADGVNPYDKGSGVMDDFDSLSGYDYNGERITSNSSAYSDNIDSAENLSDYMYDKGFKGMSKGWKKEGLLRANGKPAGMEYFLPLVQSEGFVKEFSSKYFKELAIDNLKDQTVDFTKDVALSLFDPKEIAKFLYDLYSDGENEKELRQQLANMSPEELEAMLADLMGSLTDDHTDCSTCVVQSLVQP